MSSAGGSQRKKKTVVRKESAKTPDHVPCQPNAMMVDKGHELGGHG